jgi:hypothetical protein
VAPRRNRNRSHSVAVFSCFDRIVVSGGAATKSAPYVADSRKNTIPATKSAPYVADSRKNTIPATKSAPYVADSWSLQSMLLVKSKFADTDRFL